MSFRLKLSLSFASILILMIVVSGTSIYGMRRALHHQKEFYVLTHTLEKRFQSISKKQIEYALTNDIRHSREFLSITESTRGDLERWIVDLNPESEKKQFEDLLNALNHYEASFSKYVQIDIDMETMKSRLLHESKRLMSNADAIERLGDKAVGFLKILNEALVEEKKFMIDRVRASVSMVLFKINQMIDLSEQIQVQINDSAIQLYAFRIGKIADAYQASFREYVGLYDKRFTQRQDMNLAFNQLEDQLQSCIHVVSSRENELVSLLQRLVVMIAVLSIGLGIFAIFSLINRFTGPIHDLTRSARRILEGDYSSQVKVTSADEIAQLGLSFNQMAQKLEKSFKSLARHQDKLEDLVQERTVEIQKEIHRHKETQNALEIEKNRALTYFDMAGTILMVLNPDGMIVMVNKAGRRVLGYSAKELIGKNWFDLCIPEKDRETSRQRFDQIMSGQIEYFEFLENNIQTRNGEIRIISWHNNLLKNKTGQIRAALSSGEDTTETRQMEKERKYLQEQLNQVRKMEAIGTLAGGIAHDFNNILYPIIGYTEMAIADLPKDNPIRNNLKSVFKGALRAKELVRQILTFSRKKSLLKKPLQIQPIVKEAMKLLRSSIPNNITIHIQVNETTRPVLGDPTQVYEIIMNLGTNAYHAMEKSGGQMTVRLDEETIVNSNPRKPDLQPQDYVIISVEDTGQGIPEEIQEHIFEPYFTTKETGRGSGLGLAVTHGIVSSYGGSILLESRPGEGTTFKVYLPVLQEDTLFDPFERKFEKKPGSENILLVDDEEAIVTMCSNALANLGYTIDGQTHSLNAFEVFKACPDEYDILVTDMTMPDMLGTELIQKIRHIRPELPVILCTGFSDLIDEKKAKCLNIQAYLRKPVMIDELSSTIRQIIDYAK